MTPAPKRRSDRRARSGVLSLVIMATLTGLVLTFFPWTGTLDRWSHDLPFLFRTDIRADDFVVIHLDADSAKALGGTPGQPLDRIHHARLLDRLTEQGARLVFLDFVFARTSAIPTSDAALAEAIRRNGKVILGAWTSRSGSSGVSGVDYSTTTVSRPIPDFESGALDIGFINLRTNVDGVVRELPRMNSDFVPAPYVIAQHRLGRPPAVPPGHGKINVFPALAGSGHNQTLADRTGVGINFLSRPGGLPNLPFSHALQSQVPFASNRIVFVGTRPSPGHYESDQFPTPWSRADHPPMPGVELLAHATANLIRGDALHPLAWTTQAAWTAAFSLAAVLASMFLRPVAGLGAVAGIALAHSVAAIAVHWHQHATWPWLVAPLILAPLSYVGGIGFRYRVAEVRRRRFRRAFAHYLSDEMAERIDDERLSLEPGNGVVCEATVLFTDLQGYSAIAESLELRDVGRLLSAYYEGITGEILRRNGTIIKYVGDSVMAVWGAPVEDPAHAIHAVEAALAIAATDVQALTGRPLRTRLGLCTGSVLAGNLGSSFRFDYTAIGDTTNTAARLEGMNKLLGTSILVADATRSVLRGRFVTRRLGRFVPAGKHHPLVVHEVIGRAEAGTRMPAWIETFEQGLEAWERGDFAAARARFLQVIAERGSDGPSSFLLARSGALADGTPPDGWTGEIRLSEK